MRTETDRDGELTMRYLRREVAHQCFQERRRVGVNTKPLLVLLGLALVGWVVPAWLWWQTGSLLLAGLVKGVYWVGVVVTGYWWNVERS